MNIDPSQLKWEAFADGDDPRAKLLDESFSIAGCPMHLEAFAVNEDDDGAQTAVDFSVEDDLDAIRAGVHADGPWRTVQIDGREYVLIASPYCD